jgi:hypothetical protein
MENNILNSLYAQYGELIIQIEIAQARLEKIKGQIFQELQKAQQPAEASS